MSKLRSNTLFFKLFNLIIVNILIELIYPSFEQL